MYKNSITLLRKSSINLLAYEDAIALWKNIEEAMKPSTATGKVGLYVNIEETQ